MSIWLGRHEDHIWSIGCIVDVSKLILIRRPKIHHVVVTFRCQQLPIHGGRSDDRDLSWMTDDLLDFEVGVLLGWVIIKKGFEFVDEVMFVIGYFQVCHYDVVGCVGPIVIIHVVDSISLAGEVESLDDEFVILLEKRAPLDWCDGPIEDVFVDEVVKAVIILSPLDDAIGLTHLHIAPSFIIMMIL